MHVTRAVQNLKTNIENQIHVIAICIKLCSLSFKEEITYQTYLENTNEPKALIHTKLFIFLLMPAYNNSK